MIRRTCLLLAVAGLFLQSSQGGHMLLVEHTRCAEHGDLVHGEAHEHGVAGQVSVKGRAFESGPESSVEAAHEHCSHASERRDAVADVSESDLVELRALTHATENTALLALSERIPLYRTAPKNSPPA